MKSDASGEYNSGSPAAFSFFNYFLLQSHHFIFKAHAYVLFIKTFNY